MNNVISILTIAKAALGKIFVLSTFCGLAVILVTVFIGILLENHEIKHLAHIGLTFFGLSGFILLINHYFTICKSKLIEA